MGGVKLHSFVYCDSSGTTKTLDLTSGRRYKSNESCGVWVFRGSAWKIFSSMGNYQRMLNDYDNARVNNVPIPSYQFIQGTVTQADRPKLSKPGFALVSTHVSGRNFKLAHSTVVLKNAIKPITDVNVLWRIEKALEGAVKIGLADPQGFIDPTNASNPIVFIDIHIGVAPEYLQDMYDYVSAQRSYCQSLGY